MDNTFKPSKNIVEIERFQYTVVALFKYFDMLTIASQVNICKDIIAFKMFSDRYGTK